jgi:catechol 2,3-dioxygenase-like lactoylglutathione lyase family enzyme
MEYIVNRLINEFEHGRMNRRQLIQSLSIAAAAAAVPSVSDAAERTGFKAVAVNHISYGVADYARTRDFYADLFGMRVADDNGKQCYLAFGDSFIVVRKTDKPEGKPHVDHIAYTINNWDKIKVEAELRQRGHDPRLDTENSFHIMDPDGFDVQISGKDMKV